MGIQQISDDAKKIKGVSDIVFCFDCTGSMTEIIANVKENVDKFADGLGANSEVVLDWRARAMGYRDFEVDDEYLLNDNPFVSTPEDLKEQIAGMEAKEYTGGDDPESTIDAIWYAMKKSPWRVNCHKVIVLFTDETTKGVNDKTLADIPGSSADIDLLLQELNVEHIKLFLWGKTDPMYETLSKQEKAHVYQLDDPATEFKNINFDEVMSVIGKTVSDLISE